MRTYDKLSDRERDKIYAKGSYLFDVSEDILVAMDDLGITRADLARQLGKKPPQITKWLDGAANMTLGTLSDIAFELGLTLDKTFKEYSTQRTRIPDIHEYTCGIIDFNLRINQFGNNIVTDKILKAANSDTWKSVPHLPELRMVANG